MRFPDSRRFLCVTLGVLALASAVAAQVPRQRPEFGPGPWDYDTFERDTRIHVSKVAEGLSHPWAMAWLPNGDILITERPGRLRIIRNGVLDPKPIEGVPEVDTNTLGGLLDIALHPDFENNHWVYLAYTKEKPEGVANILARARWDGEKLVDLEDIFVPDATGAKRGAGSRIEFAPDGKIFFSYGGAGQNGDLRAQDPNSDGGKIHRLNDDGSIPNDNPFVGRPGYKPSIFSMGHRNPTGMAINPKTGELWSSEQGPQGGDEINIIRAGQNYGWPKVTYGRDYDGSFVSDRPWSEEFTAPWLFFVPSIATAEIAFYTGDQFPAWKGNLFVSGMVEARLPNTGQLQRIVLNEEGGELRREPFFRQWRQRIRSVAQGPDGNLYLLTDEDPTGTVLKIEPAK